jgi:hypothetical protein
MNVRGEKCSAAAALASARLGLHRAPSGKKTQPFDQSKTDRKEDAKTKKEEKFLCTTSKKITGKKTEFQTASFPPLSFRRRQRGWSVIMCSFYRVIHNTSATTISTDASFMSLSAERDVR